jgi:hypothetical protein
MEGWRVGGMEGWRVGGLEQSSVPPVRDSLDKRPKHELFSFLFLSSVSPCPQLHSSIPPFLWPLFNRLIPVEVRRLSVNHPVPAASSVQGFLFLACGADPASTRYGIMSNYVKLWIFLHSHLASDKLRHASAATSQANGKKTR